MATKKIVKATDKKKTQWLGAQSLMGPKPQQGTKEYKERSIVLLTSKVMGVSPFGVNILGNVPYVNKLGLEQKADQYSKGVQYKYQWAKRAMDDNEKAICDCKVVDAKGKDLCDWISGECSSVTMKMGTLKGYQNHMAQTRAKNRAIREAFGKRIHEEMMENIRIALTKKEIDESQATLIGSSASSSVEEVQITKDRPTTDIQYIPVDKNHAPIIEAECHECGNAISKAEAEFSKKLYKVQLCRDCQKLVREKKIYIKK